MKRLAILVYGLFCYAVFLGTFTYAIGFVGNLIVPKSVDSGTLSSFWPSLLIDVGLLGLFGLQHSVMARFGFKRWWTKIIPSSIERSTYVLFASLALILLFWQWRPLPGTIWSVQSDLGRIVMWILFGLGWMLVVAATFMISHTHLFGVSQVHDAFRGRNIRHPGFQTPYLYRYVRHPLMAGFFVAFWATPMMTGSHLLFAVITTVYILVAVQFEERDLSRAIGAPYEAYRRRVPMFIPGTGADQTDVQPLPTEQQ